jgi:hypothetical protein
MKWAEIKQFDLTTDAETCMVEVECGDFVLRHEAERVVARLKEIIAERNSHIADLRKAIDVTKFAETIKEALQAIDE